MVNSLDISSRERKVIELLLKKQAAITVKEIADELDVSERTVHRDVKRVEKIIYKYNLELVKRSGVGLRIIGEENDKRQLNVALSTIPVADFTSEERQSIILATLLEMNEPLKLFTLANELKVTTATISHDLDQVEQELATNHLSLIRKRGYGVEIEGGEADKRRMLSHLISKHVNPFEFVSLIKGNIQKKSQQQLNTISNRLLGLVNPEKLSKIEKRVHKARKELPYELADSGFIGLVVHLALAIERLQKGDTIEFDQTYLKQMEGTKEYVIAQRMIRDLEDTLEMRIPDDEIGYITMHLMGAKLRFDQNYLIEDASVDIAFQAKELIQYVSTHLEADLTENVTLLNDLVAHLKPAIYRLNQQMSINNPLVKEIKQDYDVLFHIIRDGVRATFPGMDFPDDEIGYLVLHFAATLMRNEEDVQLKALVICSTGIGTAKMLATKLKQKVPEIKQVENKSLFDLPQVNVETYDIIASTIPLKEFHHDYFLVTPMLTKSEIDQIKKVIRKRKLAFHTKKDNADVKLAEKTMDSADFIGQLEVMQNYSRAILDLLQSFHVYQMTGKQTLLSILRSACMALEKKQIIIDREAVFKKLQLREQLGGLGIPNTSIALYHTRSTDIVKPTFSIYTFKDPLTVQGMDGKSMPIDTILLLLAPEITYKEVLEVLSFLSTLLIQDPKSVAIFTSGDETKIKQYLSEQFYKFSQEKNLL